MRLAFLVLAEVPGTNPATGSYRYYMGDHLGSVRTMRDQNKASLANYEYMPYGEAYNQTGLALNKGFTGHTWDKDDGLYYAPYRYYNPVASRWLTRDPLGMVDGPNIYSYVRNKPNIATDPLGMSQEESLSAKDNSQDCDNNPCAKEKADVTDCQNCCQKSWAKFRYLGSGRAYHCLQVCKSLCLEGDYSGKNGGLIFRLCMKLTKPPKK